MNDRERALRDLVECRLPLDAVVARLRALPWDSEVELVSLDGSHVASVLQRFIEGALSAGQVEAWADALEGRDDVQFGDDVVSEALSWLSSPEINGAITPPMATEWIRRHAPPPAASNRPEPNSQPT